jgi:hypothetical protein
VQVLKLCQKRGLVKLGHVALDGTKMKANASKHKAMSYARMKQEEEKLSAKVAELMAQAEAVDAQEDAEYGKGRRGDELPEDLRRATSRLSRIRAARAELEAEAREQAAAERAAKAEAAQVEQVVGEMKNIEATRQLAPSDDDEQEPPSAKAVLTPEPMPSNQVPADKDAVPEPKAQRNFTDAQSRIMKTADGFVQGYNAHVDEAHQIIVAQDVSNQSPDAQHFIPMLDRVSAGCGAAPVRLSADSGFFSDSNVERASARGVDVYVATGRTKHEASATLATAEGETEDLSVRARMKAKRASGEGKRQYARRKAVVEPVFGQNKNRGFRGFLLRGIDKVRGEWSLITTTHNLLKLFGAVRHLRRALVAAPA